MARGIVLRFARRSWDTLALAVALLGFLGASLSLGRVAGWIPRIVLAVAVALAGLQLVLEFRESVRIQGTDARPVLEPIRVKGPLVVAAWVAALMLAVLLFGNVMGSGFFCVAYLRRHARESWPTSLAVGLALGAAVLLVFGLLPDAQLYPGLLPQAVGLGRS